MVSALGGSRFQIGGPAGAFIVLVAATVARFGLEGLLLTVLMSGLMLTLLGVLRLGSLIRHIPHAVTVGFTCGIAMTILASQLKDLGGLHLPVRSRARCSQAGALAGASSTFEPGGPGLQPGDGGGDLRRAPLSPHLAGHADRGGPPPYAALVASAGGKPSAAGSAAFLTAAGRAFRRRRPLVLQVLPAALSFTLLGGVESLLSAKVADGMTGRKHRSNMELVAQGLANMASAVFGGITVTGTIARTATNMRAGGVSPLSGMMHSGFLLLFILVAAPLASYVPLAALAGVLLVVAWNMAEKAEFLRLLGDWRTAAVLLATFGLTLAKDLTSGIRGGLCPGGGLRPASARHPRGRRHSGGLVRSTGQGTGRSPSPIRPSIASRMGLSAATDSTT